MLSEVYNIVADFSGFSVIVPTIVAVLNFRYLNRSMKIILLYLILSFAAELFVMNVSYTVVEFMKFIELALIAGIYSQTHLFDNRHSKLIGILVFIAFIILTIEISTRRVGIFDGVAHTMVSSLSVAGLIRIIRQSESNGDVPHNFFWFNSAFLIYFSATFLLYIWGEAGSRDSARIIWIAHNIVNVVYYTLFTIGFWKQRLVQSFSVR